MANQALYRTNPDTDRGIDVTADADWTPSDRSRNNQDLTVGMRLNEPLPGQQNLSPWQIVEQLQPRCSPTLLPSTCFLGLLLERLWGIRCP
jgi:hypothetical protein